MIAWSKTFANLRRISLPFSLPEAVLGSYFPVSQTLFVYPVCKSINQSINLSIYLSVCICDSVCEHRFIRQHPQWSHAVIICFNHFSRTGAKNLWRNISSVFQVCVVTGLKSWWPNIFQDVSIFVVRCLKTQGLWYWHQTRLASLRLNSWLLAYADTMPVAEKGGTTRWLIPLLSTIYRVPSFRWCRISSIQRSHPPRFQWLHVPRPSSYQLGRMPFSTAAAPPSQPSALPPGESDWWRSQFCS